MPLKAKKIVVYVVADMRLDPKPNKPKNGLATNSVCDAWQCKRKTAQTDESISAPPTASSYKGRCKDYCK